MAQLWAWLLGPRAVVADGVMRVNLARTGNTLENNLGSSSLTKTQPTPPSLDELSSLPLAWTTTPALRVDREPRNGPRSL